MIEQFDKQLRDHIKDTFDVYDDLMEHDGWLQYQRKVKRKKRIILFWWSMPSGIAATIALLLLFNINNDVNVVNKDNIAKVAKPIISSENSVLTKKTTEVLGKKNNRYTEKIQNNKVLIPTVSKEVSINYAVNNVENESSKATNLASFSTNLLDSAKVENNITESSSVVFQNPASKEDASISILDKNDSPNIINNGTAINKEFNNSFSDFATSAFNESRDEEKSNAKKLKLGLDASTFMNFTKDGMSQDMNLGVGLASELKISKNFSINSGININKQSASYAYNEVSNNSETFNKMNSALVNDMSAAKTAPIVKDNSYDARLVGFDIPLALKYSSNNKNLNWFISTGFSSYTILSETYLNNVSTTNYGLNGMQTTNEVVVEEIKDDPFSNIQLARTLNLSIGFTFPLKDVTSLSVEPFVKYPLKGFGREDLTIGSSGVSLKLNLDKRLFK